MKSQIKRFSKSTLSVLLSICMLISCMTVGMITVNSIDWYDYSGNKDHFIYYDDSVANISEGGTKNIYLLMDYGSGSNVFTMSRVSTDTLLYKYTYNNKWSGCTAMAVKAGTTVPDSSTRYTSCDRYTTSGNFNGNAVVYMYGSKTGVTLSASAWNANGGDLKENIKNNVTLSTKVADYGSNTYTSTSTTIATLSLQSVYWNNGIVSSMGTATGFANGSVTYNNAVGAAKITFGYSDLSSSYNFIGWYDSDGNELGTGSTYTGYQNGHMSNVTYYAYFQKKEDVYGVVGSTDLTGNNWDVTSSDNDMTKSGTTYTKVFSNIANGEFEFKIAKNRSWATSWGYDSSKVSFSGLASDNDSQSGNNIKFKTTASSNITITFDSSTENITVNAVSNLSQLSAPTNVKISNATSTTVDASPSGSVTLSWSAVTNAGSYKIYKDDVLVTTVTSTTYSIAKKYSNSGTYKVVAVPSNSSTHSESDKSSGASLTVNKISLPTPTVTISPLDIASGSSTTATFSNYSSSLSSYISNGYATLTRGTRAYQANSGSFVTNTAVTSTTGSETLSPTSSIQYGYYMAVTSAGSEYYNQSGNSSFYDVYVAVPSYKIAGGLAGTNWNYNDGIAFTNYTSNGIFYFASSPQSSGDHYFSFYDSSGNQYSGDNGTSDFTITLGEENKYDIVKNTNAKSYKVNGSGVFMVFYDSVNNKMWVTQNTWAITPHVYYQSYNLTTDSYNAVAEGTTGGTISPDTETLVTKNSSTTLTATPASGYTFDGWYTSSDFTSSTKVYDSASYTFTPTANGDYYALFKQNTPAHYNVKLSFTSTQVNLSATYNGTTINTNNATMSVPVGATVTYTMTAKTGAQITARDPSSLITSNSGTFTMPSSETTIAIASSWIEYNLTGSVNPAHGSVKFYSNSECTTEITKAIYNRTVYVKYTSADGYVLKNFTRTSNGASTNFSHSNNVGSFTMPAYATSVVANVMLEYSVTYYIDMHDNNVSSLSIALVSNMGGGTTLTNSSGTACSANLTRVNSSSKVYSATIDTPVTTNGSSYNDLYVKVTFNGTAYTPINLPGSKISNLISSREMWLEAENETSTQLTLNYSTNSTTTVADGYRRIYLAKPYNWQNTESSWENIGIYHWGDYTDIGWNNGIKMHYLGYSGTGENDYHYYYADIPKALASDGTTVVTDGTGNKVSNIIFQGWGSNTTAGSYGKAQTGNIENIADSANFFILSKDGNSFKGTAGDSVTLANYTRYVSSVVLNKTETTAASVKPTYTGENITYTSNDTNVVTVDSDGTIHPQNRGTATITVKIYGTIGSLLSVEDNDHKDYRTYTVTVTVKDPTQFNGFEIMSLESKTYTVNIPTVNGDQPGYFDMNNVVMTVEGIKGVTSSTNSAIITQTTQNIPGVEDVCTSFTVQYAKANSLFDGYSGISVSGKIVTTSIRREGGQRYGHDHWTPTDYTTSRVIDNGVETATTASVPFDSNSSSTTYSAIFAAYSYVDVTFTFNYDEYNPKKVDVNDTPEDDSDDMINYFYQADWADENKAQGNYSSSHNTKTYVVSNFEVREQTASSITAASLVTPATNAIGVMPDNNYYNYQITGATINITNQNTGAYTATVTVNMTHKVKYYHVYVNGIEVQNPDTSSLSGADKYGYTYQAYATKSGMAANTLWYGVTKDNNSTSNAPLLAQGSEYKFRVKGDTYIQTGIGTVSDNNFNRSEVGFSHYETTHMENSSHQNVEYLLQNFYIADFFDKTKVIDPNSVGGIMYDDPEFVGGGVVYYSMTNGSPTANAMNSGYVDQNGIVNTNQIKAMLKSKIEAQYSVDNLAGEYGENDAMKVAYGTEIPVTQNVENGMKTGILYRYLPLNTYKRDSNGVLEKVDGEYTFASVLNSNTFRYSNSLQSYQYIYASGNENKATNSGRNMRLYSYYVYSYLTYNQETNVPETKYEIILSDQYSDASTYWDGKNNP